MFSLAAHSVALAVLTEGHICCPQAGINITPRPWDLRGGQLYQCLSCETAIPPPRSSQSTCPHPARVKAHASKGRLLHAPLRMNAMWHGHDVRAQGRCHMGEVARGLLRGTLGPQSTRPGPAVAQSKHRSARKVIGAHARQGFGLIVLHQSDGGNPAQSKALMMSRPVFPLELDWYIAVQCIPFRPWLKPRRK